MEVDRRQDFLHAAKGPHGPAAHRRRHHEHRARRGAQHAFSDRAEDELADAALAARGQDDELRIDLVCNRQDATGRLAHGHAKLMSRSAAGTKDLVHERGQRAGHERDRLTP